MDTNQNHRMIVDPDEDNYLLCFFPLRSITGFKKFFFGGRVWGVEGVRGGIGNSGRGYPEVFALHKILKFIVFRYNYIDG